MYWPGEERLARTVSQMASAPAAWPGIGVLPPAPLTIILAGSSDRFDSLVGRPEPPWVQAIAIPEARTIVLRVHGDPTRTLRHELAHLALHAVVPSAPRWFDEGYAAYAAGEWDRMDALTVDWELVRGAIPTLDDLNRELVTGGPVRTSVAYALSETAVAFLARIGGERGLGPIITAMRRNSSFDRALREAHAVTLDHFEELWQRDLRRRYGWLSFLASAGIFWGVLGVVLVIAWWWRRRRNQARRSQLDEGWEIPPDDTFPSS